MTFGEAIQKVREGARIQRKGWNGKNQYVELATCLSYKNAAGEIVNAADMLADDWEIAVLDDAKKEPMELKDTIAGMQSQDYKERFKAEYYQVVIRFKKLVAMLEKWDKGKLTFTPTCPRGIYNFQIRSMADYIAVLEARAMIEGIELNS